MAAARRRDGVSLAKGPIAIAGMILLAFGVTGLLFGGHSLATHIPDGVVQGKGWLGIEVNAWTSLLFIAGGALLLFGSPLHWGAKTAALVVGVTFAACAVIALIDGSDVLGIFAANHGTKLAWAIAGAALIVLGLLPKTRGRRDDDVYDDDRVVAGRRTRGVTTRDRDMVDDDVVAAPRGRRRFVRDGDREAAYADERETATVGSRGTTGTTVRDRVDPERDGLGR
jgi:hypothetical protein